MKLEKGKLSLGYFQILIVGTPRARKPDILHLRFGP